MIRYRIVGPRWYKVWADLISNKLRTFLVVLSITIGVFAVGVVSSCYIMFQRDMTNSWQSAWPAHVNLYADRFDEALVDSIRSLRGVKEADGRFNVELRAQSGEGQWKQLWLTAIPDYMKQKVNIVRTVTGAWPPGDGDVLMERSSLKQLNIRQGDHIVVETAAGRKRSLKITGVVYDPSQTPSLFSGRCYGYINMDTLEKVDEERKLNQVNLIVDSRLLQGKETAEIEAIGRRAYTKLEQGDIVVSGVRVNRPEEHQMQGIVDALLLLLAVLGVLSLFLSTFLLVNTVMAILAQQVRQLAIMKAIGARRGQILGMYLTLVAAYGLLALILAIPLGATAANAMTGFVGGLFNFDAGGMVFPVQVLLMEGAVAVLVPLAAAVWPLWRGTGLTVREAISDYGIQNVSKSRLNDGVHYALKKLGRLPRPVVLSLRNTFRARGRLMLTLVTLTLAGTVFMSVFSVRSSLGDTLERALAFYRYDIMIGFSESYRGQRIEQQVLRVPGVEAAEAWGLTSGRILRDGRKQSESQGSTKVAIYGVPVNSNMIQPEIMEGRWLTPEDERALVVNTEVLKDSPHLRVGAPAFIKVGARKLRFTIVGIAQGMLAGPYVYAPYVGLNEAIQESGRARSVRIAAPALNTVEQKDLSRRLEEHLKKNSLKVEKVNVTWEDKKLVQARFDILIVFLLIMALLLAVVGALGLAGTMSINVLERIREIGVMRAIGASSVDIGKIFVVEALFIGVLSWLAGAALAFPIAAVLCRQVGMLFLNGPMPVSFSLAGVAIWFVISIVLSVLASLLPAWNAARMSVQEVLGYE